MKCTIKTRNLDGEVKEHCSEDEVEKEKPNIDKVKAYDFLTVEEDTKLHFRVPLDKETTAKDLFDKVNDYCKKCFDTYDKATVLRSIVNRAWNRHTSFEALSLPEQNKVEEKWTPKA